MIFKKISIATYSTSVSIISASIGLHVVRHNKQNPGCEKLKCVKYDRKPKTKKQWRHNIVLLLY